jgi:hypothetical protein
MGYCFLGKKDTGGGWNLATLAPIKLYAIKKNYFLVKKHKYF